MAITASSPIGRDSGSGRIPVIGSAATMPGDGPAGDAGTVVGGEDGRSTAGTPGRIVRSSPGGIPENAGTAAPAVPPVGILVLTRGAAPPCGMACAAVVAA